MTPPTATTFAHAFCSAFERARSLYSAFDGDGLLILGVRRNRAESYVHLPIGEGVTHGILGRHTACDLSLARDSQISLRHAVISAWRVGLHDVRICLRDLATRARFVDERGETCLAVVAEGPLFVRIGEYHVFVFPTGNLADYPWEATAEDTWNTLPQRVYLDTRIPARSATGRPTDEIPCANAPVALPDSGLRVLRQPNMDVRQCCGAISVETGAHRVTIPVRERDLDEGLIVGRYERCHLGIPTGGLSRVHLMLTRDAGEVWAIDTASRNGTTLDGLPIRQARLNEGTEVVLARSLVLRWHPSPVAPSQP